MANELTPLNKTELSQLREYEEVIERGQRTFIDVGNALLAIRENRLYKANFKTFGEYCKDRWGYAKSHAYRMIESAKVVDNLSPIGDKNAKRVGFQLPTTESQVRPLSQLTTPEQQSAAWQDAIDLAKERDQPITAAVVVEVVAQHVAQAEPYQEEAEAESDEGVPWEETEKPKSDPVKDALGNVVDESVSPIFEHRKTFKEIMQAISEVKKNVHALIETQAGCWIDGQEIDRLLTDAYSLLKFSAPHTECAKCRRKPKKNCPACKGAGWVHSAMYKTAFSDEEKEWVGKAS